MRFKEKEAREARIIYLVSLAQIVSQITIIIGFFIFLFLAFNGFVLN